MPIPSVPENLKYEAGGLSIFLGLEICSTYGHWITLDSSTDPDEVHAYGKALCDAYNLDQGGLYSGGEYGLMDAEGFPVRPGNVDEALLLAELAELMDDTKLAALGDWVEHRGHDYALYNSGKLQSADEIAEQFDEDYIGTYESEEDYAQERLGEMWDNGLDMKARKEMEYFARYVFNYMNWERLARDFEVDDVWYGERNEHGYPVFWRN